MDSGWSVTNNKGAEEAVGSPYPHRIAPYEYEWQGRTRILFYLRNPQIPGKSAIAVEATDPDRATRVAEQYFNTHQFSYHVERGLLGTTGGILIEPTKL